MTEKPRILCVNNQSESTELTASLRGECNLVEVDSPLRALALLSRDQFDGLYITRDHLAEALRLGHLLQHERIVAGMPDGVGRIELAARRIRLPVGFVTQRRDLYPGEVSLPGHVDFQSHRIPRLQLVSIHTRSQVEPPDGSREVHRLALFREETSELQSRFPKEKLFSFNGDQPPLLVLRDLLGEMGEILSL